MPPLGKAAVEVNRCRAYKVQPWQECSDSICDSSLIRSYIFMYRIADDLVE